MKCRQLATKLSGELTKTELWTQTGTGSIGAMIVRRRRKSGPTHNSRATGCDKDWVPMSWRRCPCGCPVAKREGESRRCPSRICYFFQLVESLRKSNQIKTHQIFDIIWFDCRQPQMGGTQVLPRQRKTSRRACEETQEKKPTPL